MTQLTVDLSDVEKSNEAFERLLKQLPNRVALEIKNTLKDLSRAVPRLVSSTYNIAAGEVTRALKISSVSPARRVGNLTVTGRNLSLKLFGAVDSRKKAFDPGAGGVSFQVRRNAPRTALRNAFVAKAQTSGKLLVFSRQLGSGGRRVSRLSVTSHETFSVAGMTAALFEDIDKLAKKRLSNRLATIVSDSVSSSLV